MTKYTNVGVGTVRPMLCHSAVPLATADPPGVLLAIGVLTHPSSVGRRQTVRSSWGSALPSDVILRFVIGGAGRGRLSEADRDVVALESVAEGRTVLLKALGWMRLALSRWSPAFVARADDDAFVNLRLVVPDLRRLLQLRLAHVAYGAVEWFAFDRGSGVVRAWGRSPTQVAGVWRSAVAERGSNLTAPFPFLKGPFFAYGAPLARRFLESDHARAQLAPAAVKPVHPKELSRTLDEVHMGFILATAPAGASARPPPTSGEPGGEPSHSLSAVTLVDTGLALLRGAQIRTGGGFLELRPNQDLASAALACFRAVHLGGRIVGSLADRRPAGACGSRGTAMGRPARAGSCTRGEVLSASMAELLRVRGAPSNRTTLCCGRAQPKWSEQSTGLIRGHAEWTHCHFRGVALCEPPTG